MDQFDREEELLEQQLANGEITNAEFNRAIRELHMEYRECAQEAAERAYENEMINW